MSASIDDNPLLQVDGLEVTYGSRKSRPSVRDVTFDARPGETVALIGESGSGKSTIGKAVLGLSPITAGTVRFDGKDITRARGAERRRLSADVQVVFQNPYGSLNPSLRIGDILGEPLVVSGLPRAEARERVATALDSIGLPAAAAERFPREFSGGQRQRIAIARAFIREPRLVIADEALSALDLSVQASVLNLLMRLQEQTRASFLFISHDLALVENFADRIIVLRGGEIVEQGDAATVCGSPAQAYTRRLLDAVLSPDPELMTRKRAHRTAARGSGRR